MRRIQKARIHSKLCRRRFLNYITDNGDRFLISSVTALSFAFGLSFSVWAIKPEHPLPWLVLPIAGVPLYLRRFKRLDGTFVAATTFFLALCSFASGIGVGIVTLAAATATTYIAIKLFAVEKTPPSG